MFDVIRRDNVIVSFFNTHLDEGNDRLAVDGNRSLHKRSTSSNISLVYHLQSVFTGFSSTFSSSGNFMSGVIPSNTNTGLI